MWSAAADAVSAWSKSRQQTHINQDVLSPGLPPLQAIAWPMGEVPFSVHFLTVSEYIAIDESTHGAPFVTASFESVPIYGRTYCFASRFS